MKLAAALLLTLLAGCAGMPNCYVGISLIPPMPIVMCGVDTAPEDDDV